MKIYITILMFLSFFISACSIKLPSNKVVTKTMYENKDNGVIEKIEKITRYKKFFYPLSPEGAGLTRHKPYRKDYQLIQGDNHFSLKFIDNPYSMSWIDNFQKIEKNNIWICFKKIGKYKAINYKNFTFYCLSSIEVIVFDEKKVIYRKGIENCLCKESGFDDNNLKIPFWSPLRDNIKLWGLNYELTNNMVVFSTLTGLVQYNVLNNELIQLGNKPLEYRIVKKNGEIFIEDQ